MTARERKCENFPDCSYGVSSMAGGRRNRTQCPICDGELVDPASIDADLAAPPDDYFDGRESIAPDSRPSRDCPPSDIPTLGEAIVVETNS